MCLLRSYIQTEELKNSRVARGMQRAGLLPMAKKNQDQPMDHSVDPNVVPPLDPINPQANPPSYPMAPDLTPTAAEYERDAILEKERLAKKAEERVALEQANKDGKLPPGAQTLEDARAALQRAEDRTLEEQEARKRDAQK